MSVKSPLVLHRNVALMICENAAVLEETLATLDLSSLPVSRIGDRAIAAPIGSLTIIRQALHQQGTYPKIVGELGDQSSDITETIDSFENEQEFA